MPVSVENFSAPPLCGIVRLFSTFFPRRFPPFFRPFPEFSTDFRLYNYFHYFFLLSILHRKGDSDEIQL